MFHFNIHHPVQQQLTGRPACISGPGSPKLTCHESLAQEFNRPDILPVTQGESIS